MKRFVLFILLAASVGFAQQQGPAPAPKAKVLSRAEFDHLLETPGQILLLDVRGPNEIAINGGFPVYLSVQAADLEKHLSEIPKDRRIVTVSNHANRASRAADLLESKGFKIAGAIGAQVYESEGGKLVKFEPPKPSAADQK